ncbi:MAG: hypothetical protein JW737_06565, partial [Acidobacteria bacterium]|nr:hypothetical protein [Acidobacteriota bacterium]
MSDNNSKGQQSCIFCGKLAKNSTNEDVIPKWLQNVTAFDSSKTSPCILDIIRENRWEESIPEQPNKIVMEVKLVSPNLIQCLLPNNKVLYPACYLCNQRYSKDFENNSSSAVKKLLKNRQITKKEVSTLLDWFDKMRLILRYVIWQNEANTILPRIVVDNLIRFTDRVLAIYKTDDTNQKFQVFWIKEPAFVQWPVCLCMKINNLYFFNISAPFLVSKCLGFPYPVMSESKWNLRSEIVLSNGLQQIIQHYKNALGTQTISNDVLEKKILDSHLLVFQPVYSDHKRMCSQPEAYLENEWIKKNSEDFDYGLGKIYYHVNDIVKEIPKNNIKMKNIPE